MRSRVGIGAVIWLTALWVLLWNDLSVANLVAGVVVAVVVLSLTRLPQAYCVGTDEGDRPRISPLRLIGFVVYVLVKLVQSNLLLAWEILTPRNRIHSGIVAIPMRTSSELAMLVVANVITLTPGTVTIEAKGSPAVLYVNVLHLDDIERVRAELWRLEELSVRAFGSRSARRQLADAGELR